MKSGSNKFRKWDVVTTAALKTVGKCEICGDNCASKASLQTMHVISRGVIKTRFDLRNVIYGCAGKHIYYTKNPIAFADYIRNESPVAQYVDIMQRVAHQTSRFKADKDWWNGFNQQVIDGKLSVAEDRLELGQEMLGLKL